MIAVVLGFFFTLPTWFIVGCRDIMDNKRKYIHVKTVTVFMLVPCICVAYGRSDGFPKVIEIDRFRGYLRAYLFFFDMYLS